MTFFDCTADLVGQLNGNGQKGTLQIDAPPDEYFWLRHWQMALEHMVSTTCTQNFRLGACPLTLIWVLHCDFLDSQMPLPS